MLSTIESSRHFYGILSVIRRRNFRHVVIGIDQIMLRFIVDEAGVGVMLARVLLSCTDSQC